MKYCTSTSLAGKINNSQKFNIKVELKKKKTKENKTNILKLDDRLWSLSVVYCALYTCTGPVSVYLNLSQVGAGVHLSTSTRLHMKKQNKTKHNDMTYSMH